MIAVDSSSPKALEWKDAEEVRFEDIIEDTKQKLLNGGNLTLDGQPASANDIYAIISALEVSLEVGKKHSLMAAKKEMKKRMMNNGNDKNNKLH